MRISLTVPNNHRVPALLQPWQDEVGGAQTGEVARLADRLGFSRLTVGEHLLMPKKDLARRNRAPGRVTRAAYRFVRPRSTGSCIPVTWRAS